MEMLQTYIKQQKKNKNGIRIPQTIIEYLFNIRIVGCSPTHHSRC